MLLAHRAPPSDQHFDYQLLTESESIKKLLRQAEKALKKIKIFGPLDRYRLWDSVVHEAIGYS